MNFRNIPLEIGIPPAASCAMEVMNTTRNPEENFAEIPDEYVDMREVFTELTGENALPAHQSWDHEIPLIEDREPPYEKLRPLDYAQTEVLRQYIKTNLERGFIEESQSPAGFPILFVPKKDGEPRLCVDYRRLNDITVKDRYPLPLISEIFDKFSGAKIFTQLDVKEAYHQVRIKAGEEWKTAFRTRFGHFQYKVMPFGLTNAPASFQRLINNALREYLDVFATAYLDDIVIYSENEWEHKEHVRKVLSKLKEWNLRLKLKKCSFGVKKI